MAAKVVLEAIFEADFLPASFGFRPRIGTLQALETIRETVNSGGRHVLDADIRDYFGSIDQVLLMKRVAKRVSDRRVAQPCSACCHAAGIGSGGRCAPRSR